MSPEEIRGRQMIEAFRRANRARDRELRVLSAATAVVVVAAIWVAAVMFRFC